MQESLKKLAMPEILPATNEDIVAYLRRSYKLAEIAVSSERDTLILSVCEQLNITVSDEELQAGGDAFRLQNKLLGASETVTWLTQQRITVEDWSQGIRLSLLTQKLKEHLFGAAVDADYMNNRDKYRCVALSQILVRDLIEATKIAQALQEKRASFCALALEHSIGQQSKLNGGFIGIRFLGELLPEIAQAVSSANEGETIAPLQTKLGYHILRVEKWFPVTLSAVRERILDSCLQAWLHTEGNFEGSIPIM